MDSNLVNIYYNVHKKCYSIRNSESRKVISHHLKGALWVKPIKFNVNEKARKKVIETKRKNVHAYIRGIIEEPNRNYTYSLAGDIVYNPYKNETFIFRDEHMYQVGLYPNFPFNKYFEYLRFKIYQDGRAEVTAWMLN